MIAMIAHGALFPSLVCDPDTGWGPNGDRTATYLMVISPPRGLARSLPPPLAVFAAGFVLALLGFEIFSRYAEIYRD
jgi:hypothetical protein